MNWKNLLESVSESVNDDLRLRNEYLAVENRILRNQIDGRVQLSDAERRELAEIGVQLGKQALAEIATVAQADTILAWHRKFAAQTVDTSDLPKSVGRPRVDHEIENWVIRMARENRSWGYDRIQGALHHLGYTVSDQTVGNILKRHGIPSAPERKKTVTWREFVRFHLDVLLATEFFSSDIWSWFGYALSCLIGFIDGGCRQVHAVGIFLHLWIQERLSYSIHALIVHAQLERRRHGIRRVTRSWANCSGKALQANTISEFPPNEARQHQRQDMGSVVLLSAVRARRMRDGPNRYRHRIGRLLGDDYQEAA